MESYLLMLCSRDLLIYCTASLEIITEQKKVLLSFSVSLSTFLEHDQGFFFSMSKCELIWTSHEDEGVQKIRERVGEKREWVIRRYISSSSIVVSLFMNI